MPFTIAGLNQELLRDNPNYERFVHSDLHSLVALLRGQPQRWNAGVIAAEMKGIPADKWRKYGHTRRYLEREISGLKPLLRAVPTGFATVSMKSATENTILEHVFRWTSDTGNLADLATVFTRENVSWPQWPAALTACIGTHGDAYRGPGRHTGLASNPANVGRGEDRHALLGPFNESILSYSGPAAAARMDQVYEYSHDRASWLPIPGSTYTITREVSQQSGKRVQLKITKTSTTNARDSFTVTRVF